MINAFIKDNRVLQKEHFAFEWRDITLDMLSRLRESKYGKFFKPKNCTELFQKIDDLLSNNKELI